MKTFLATIACLLALSTAHGVEIKKKPIGSVRTIKKCIDLESSVIFICHDNSIWEAYPVFERSQTWGEWWYDITPENPEDHFLTDLNEWEPHSQMTVHAHRWNDGEMERYHSEDLAKCSFILFNKKTKGYAFGQKLSLELFAQKMEEYAEEKGSWSLW